MRKYKLQVCLPKEGSDFVYMDTPYWSTVTESADLAHLQWQADIMRGYWKNVRVILEEQKVIEQKVMY